MPPAATYVATRSVGNLLYVSGHGPIRGGAVIHRGKVGRDLDVEAGQAAAELTMLNVLAAAKAELGDLDRITGFVKLLVLVNATEDFEQHPAVADGASKLIHLLYGPSAVHARSAIGVASLPFSIATEIEAILEFA